MKKLSLLFASMLLTGIASAAPYIVYSGAAHSNVATTTGTVAKTCDIYLIANLADTSSYALLQFDAATRQGEIDVFPITSPTVVETNLNFFGSVDPANGAASTAILSIGDMMTDASSNSYVSHSYATGQLTTRNNILAPGRTAALNVTTATGTVSFPVATAVSSQGLPYAPLLSGTTLGYTISSTGTLTQATGAGTLSLLLNPALTAAANIGGELNGASAAAVTGNAGADAAIYPVINSSPAPTPAQAYTTWLTNLATALNVTLISSSTSTTTTATNTGGDGGDAGSITLNSGTGGGDMTLSGSDVSTGVSFGRTVGGTTLLGGNTYAGGTSINSGTVNLNGNTGGTLSGVGIGGTLTLTPVGTGSLTLSGSTGSLTLNAGGTIVSGGTSTISTGSLTVAAGGTTGTLTLITTGVGGPGSSYLGAGLGGTLTIAQGTVTITAINGSNASGNVTIAGGSYDYGFINSPLIVNGSSDLSSLAPGSVLSGSVTISSGTVTVTTQ